MGWFRRRRIDVEEVVTKGVTKPGRLVGIHVWEQSGDDTSGGTRMDDYAIDVDGVVTGVRQRLTPDDVVRLGMDVVVRQLEGSAVIDWHATCGGTNGYVAVILDEPPARGIADETIGLKKARKKGVPGTVTIERTSIRSAMFGLQQVLQLDLVVRPDGADEYELVLDKVPVPHYATHLVRLGGTLPCWVRLDRLDRVTIDWPAAAMSDPGVGVAPSDALSGVGDVFTGPAAPTGGGGVMSAAGPLAAPPNGGFGTEGGITFDEWVAVEAGLIRDRVAPADAPAYAERFGVPTGTWTAAAAAWHQRTREDWRVGAAFGEAIGRSR